MNKESSDQKNNSSDDNLQNRHEALQELNSEYFSADVSEKVSRTNSAPNAGRAEEQDQKSSWPIIIGIILLTLLIAWLLGFKNNDEQSTKDAAVKPEVVELEDTEQAKPVEARSLEKNDIESEVIEAEPVTPKNPVIELPSLNDSDETVKSRLATLTWRTELLRLVIDDDMIRRVVVFTDNFNQGFISYRHSPLAQPEQKFSTLDEDATTNAEGVQSWVISDSQTERFNVYIDLLRSFNQAQLVQAYKDFEPLFEEAYQELGYEGEFKDVLLEAIETILDTQLPHEPIAVIRPSVMYKYQNKEIESLTDADKLLLRLGKENLLAVKSVLLELNEALSQ
ncbi:MAG: DUF3014 domain-containing protein [Colwellia sp.]